MDTIIWVVLVIAGAFVLKGLVFKKKIVRKDFIETLAGYLKAKIEPIAGAENCFKLEFNYRNQPFVYEDIEEEDFNLKTKMYIGYLKTHLDVDFSLSFKEGKQSMPMAQLQSLSDLSTFHWGKGQEVVERPSFLQEFSVFTNDPKRAKFLMSDDKVARIFASFKCSDHYGRPVMSAEITKGLIELKFHHPGELSPTWAEFYGNVKAIAEYLEKLFVIAQACKKNYEEKDK